MMRRRPRDSAELVTDPGVLEPTPTLEIFGWTATAEVGGCAVVPHRGRWLAARQRSVEAFGWFGDVPCGGYTQAVVHLQKGRAATEQGLHEAWRRLEPGGRLLLVGGNELGIKSAIKRLASVLESQPDIVANRARARVACWVRDDRDPPPAPAVEDLTVTVGDDRFTLASAPGVFSADAVDPGSALLLDRLDAVEPPSRLFDPGCGVGVLGIAALRRWPDASAVLADVDHRAVGCARANADRIGIGDRCTTTWWDAVSEPAPAADCDLVLINPPFHSGVPVDLQPARRMFRAVDRVLTPGGRALVVANRTLPWERDLSVLGRVRQLADERGYKVLEIVR
jgi:16S rRNA (guanine1207-N2)-methyltransferase